jgi:cbb3-type cytochrome oxidase subunit 3
LLIVSARTSYARYEDLLHRRYAERLQSLNKVYSELASLQHSELLIHKAGQIQAFARKHRDRELELDIELFVIYRLAFSGQKEQIEVIDSLKTFISLAQKEKIWSVRIKAIRVLAEYYWQIVHNYELAFEQYLLLDRELGSLKAEEYPEMAGDLLKIAEAYYFFQDYATAKKYLQRTIAIPETELNTMSLNSARNTLGLAFQIEGQYDSSDYYFNQILATKFEKPQKEWIRIAKGNLGANRYFNKDYKSALPLLQFDFEESLKAEDYRTATGAAILLAGTYVHYKNPETAFFYLSAARNYISTYGYEDRLQHWYPIMSKWYSLIGDTKKADSNIDSTVQAINLYQQKFSALKMLKAQQKVNLRDNKILKTAYQLENAKKISQRNVLFIAVLLLVLLCIIGYLVQKNRRATIEREKQLVEDDLEKAKGEIARFNQKNK